MAFRSRRTNQPPAPEQVSRHASQARRDFLRSRLTSATVGQWCRIFMSPGHGRRRSSAASLTPLRSTSSAGNRTCGSWPLEPALADVLKHSRAGRVPFEVGPQVRPELPRSSALLTLCLQRNAPLIAASALGLDERGQSTVRWRCSRCALASASQRTTAVSKPWSEADALVRWLVSFVAPISGRFLLNPRIPPIPHSRCCRRPTTPTGSWLVTVSLPAPQLPPSESRQPGRPVARCRVHRARVWLGWPGH